MTTVNKELYYVVYYTARGSRHTTKYFTDKEHAQSMADNLTKQGYRNTSVTKIDLLVNE